MAETITSFDPHDVQHVARLRSSIESAEAGMDKYRKNRKVLLDALYDPCHQDDTPNTDDRMPINELDGMFNILTRSVVDQNPTLRIVKAKQPRVAGMLKARLEKWAKENWLYVLLQGVFHEALLRWGVVYMGYEVGENGVMPYATALDLDDYFIDQVGSDENDVDFEGHRSCRRLNELLGNRAYDQEAVAQLKSYSDRCGPEKQRTLYDRVDLIHTWLPREQIVVTLADKNYHVDKPLRVMRYQGPPWGPYMRMDLGKIRSCMVPVSRASMFYDLHEFVARTYRHVFVQADREVEGYAYSGEMEKDAEKHRRLQQDEYLKMENPNGIVPIKKGGVNPQTLATGIHASDLFSTRAGNLKLAGGLGPSAPTASQEAGLGIGVRQMIDYARLKMDTLTRQIYATVAWYYRIDTIHEETVDWTTPEGLAVPGGSEWTPETAASLDPNDPEMEIVPGSLISRSSEQQLAYVNQAVQSIAAMMSLPGEEQEVFHHRRYKELVAEYGNAPEINELFGEAADAGSVVPGVEHAAQFNQQKQGRSSGGKAMDNSGKLVERMVFSGGSPASGAGNAPSS